MKFLITGGAGYIGSNISHFLIDKGFEVLIIDNLSTGFKSLVPSLAKLEVKDIGNGFEITRIIKKFSPNIVIHLAASVEVEESTINPLKYYLNNISKSISFLNSCIEANVQNIIFSSTAAVYGNSKSKLINEKHKTNPESPYGTSKLVLEKILQDLNKNNILNSITFRYFNVAGADERKRTGQLKQPASHLIKVACETALNKRKTLYIYGNDYNTQDGSCVRDFIHISDLAELHLKAAEFLLDGGESNILNCGYGKGYSVLEVVKNLKKISENNFNVKIVNRRPGDPAELVADTTLCKKILNWEPKYDSLHKIINDAFEWEKIINEKI